jgi:predicted CXXCH cytochrome family protein
MATHGGLKCLALVIPLFAVMPLAAANYVGAEVCAKCHASEFHTWSGSRHSKMVQPATAASVQGDFARGKVELRGAPYAFRARGGAFYITESYLTGKPREHRVDYTLGNRRIQHYLATLPDGRVIVLPPSWDVLRKQWFHNLDIDDPEEEPGVQVQVWNKSCYSCHVSQQEKNFDPGKNAYRSEWLNFGTNCERCHGPASDHVAHYSAKPATAGPAPAKPARDIVLQTRLTPERNTMVCAQCHSFRDIYVNNFAAGDDYYDHFLPVLDYNLPDSEDPAYWPDNRTRRFSNDAFGLWQSECYLKGKTTCVDCHVRAHEPEIERNAQLRPDANALCTRCHESIGKSVAAHTHHAPSSAGSSCVECHMPRTVYSIKAEIRDHSMSIPVPENTIRHGIPNACNLCHKDRDANWSLAQMNRWYNPASRQKLIRRADAFVAARKNDPASIASLLAILAAPSEGPLTRANAAGYLGRFLADPRVFPALEAAVASADSPVRAVAVLGLTPPAPLRSAAISDLRHALADTAATVRIAALVSLVSLGVRQLDGEDGARFAAARKLFDARAALNSDDAGQQVAAGRFYFLAADPERAIDAFRASLKLDPAIPSQYFLAGAYVEKGDLTEARKILEAIPAGDSQYEKAQRLLKVILSQMPK